MRPIDRRSLLLGLAGLPLLASCGLELTRPEEGDDPTRRADPATLRQGGTLRWALDELPVNFNYNQADMTGYTSNVVASFMPSTFIGNSQGQLRVNTDYFTSIEITSDAPQTLVYTINPKAHWSDGTPITWEDLYWQWQANSGANADYQMVGTFGYRDIGSVTRGADDRQAVVAFATPYGDWQGLFSFLYPKSTNNSPQVFNKGWILSGTNAVAPVTAGPFKIGTFDNGLKRLTVVADPNWWGSRPRLDAIVFLELPREAQIGALQNGEVDWVNLLSSAPNLAIAENTKGMDIRSGLSPDISVITFNGKAGTLMSDVRLRRAVAKGVDRAKMASTLLGAISTRTAPANNVVLTRDSIGYEDDGASWPFDPAAARNELDALGWVRNGQFRAKDGKPLRIRLVIPAQTPASADIGKILQQMLAEIGAQLVIDPVSSAGFFRDYINLGDFDLTIIRWGHTPYIADTGNIYGIYKDANGNPNILQNFGQIGSDQLNDLIARMQKELDPVRARQLANEVDRGVAEIMHSVPLYQVPYNWAVRSDLRNFGPSGYADTDYTAIGYAK